MKKKGDNLSKHFFCMSLWILIISGQRRNEVWKKLLTSNDLMIFLRFHVFKTLGFENEGFQSKATATAHEIIFSLFSVKLKSKWQKYLYANSERIWPHFMMYCPHSVLSPAKTRREMCISIDLSSKHLDSKRDWPILPYFSSLGTIPSSELADFLKVDGWRIWWKPSFML